MPQNINEGVICMRTDVRKINVIYPLTKPILFVDDILGEHEF